MKRAGGQKKQGIPVRCCGRVKESAAMILFGNCKRIGRRQKSRVSEAQEERASAQALGRGSTGEVPQGRVDRRIPPE